MAAAPKKRAAVKQSPASSEPVTITNLAGRPEPTTLEEVRVC